MRDLLTDPAWRPEDLGVPLPDTLHAVSVALPAWQDVIDYEEGHPRIAAALRAGYPRFFTHPLVTDLFQRTEAAVASPGEGCIVFPTRPSAARALAYAAARTEAPLRLADGPGGTTAVVFAEAARRIVRECWRFCGEALSSRRAAWILAGNDAPSPDMEAAGRLARDAIRRRLADAHGITPDHVFLFASGMAAVAAAHRLVTTAHPGRPTVQLDFPYVDALKVQQEFGSGVRFFPHGDDDAAAEIRSLAAAGAIAAVFTEMPSNPLLRSVRLSTFAPALRDARIPLVVDDTIASVAAIEPLRAADLVTTSLTKSFSGAGDVMAGALVVNPSSPHRDAFVAALSAEFAGHDPLWCEDAAVLEVNSRDFHGRVARSAATAAALAEWLRGHPRVDTVWYPQPGDGLDELLLPGAGRGCLLSFTLRDPAATPGVHDRLRLCKGPSLGTNFSLCCAYTLLAHYTELDWAASCGVPAHLLRVSAGLEPLDELIGRFAEALA